MEMEVEPEAEVKKCRCGTTSRIESLYVLKAKWSGHLPGTRITGIHEGCGEGTRKETSSWLLQACPAGWDLAFVL